MNESEKTKMDPETAIKVLKMLDDWLILKATTKEAIEMQHSVDEAIQIAIAALEEKTQCF